MPKPVFDHGTRFSSTPGYSLIRGKNKEPPQERYQFPGAGTFRVACKMQHDLCGRGMWTDRILVE